MSLTVRLYVTLYEPPGFARVSFKALSLSLLPGRCEAKGRKRQPGSALLFRGQASMRYSSGGRRARVVEAAAEDQARREGCWSQKKKEKKK